LLAYLNTNPFTCWTSSKEEFVTRGCSCIKVAVFSTKNRGVGNLYGKGVITCVDFKGSENGEWALTDGTVEFFPQFSLPSFRRGGVAPPNSAILVCELKALENALQFKNDSLLLLLFCVPKYEMQINYVRYKKVVRYDNSSIETSTSYCTPSVGKIHFNNKLLLNRRSFCCNSKEKPW